MKITFTEYDTGNPVFLDSEFIVGIRQLSVVSCNLTGQEEGQRTRIDMVYGDTILVTESAVSVATQAGWPDAQPR